VPFFPPPFLPDKSALIKFFSAADDLKGERYNQTAMKVNKETAK
jgi:hypothetical protein